MPSAIDLEACYRRYGPMVYRRCLRLLRSEAQAEEAMHDVFVELLRRRERLLDQGQSSLLFQTATHVSLNRLRARRRHPEHPDDRLLALITYDDGLEERTLTEALLRQLFGSEPTSTRVMAVLHFVDGMTLEEVALEVGLSVSGVRKRLRKLREKLSTLTEDTHEPA
jgi:RNA polymerase sigma-70 factor (ECF subfamily)